MDQIYSLIIIVGLSLLHGVFSFVVAICLVLPVALSNRYFSVWFTRAVTVEAVVFYVLTVWRFESNADIQKMRGVHIHAGKI